MRAIKTLLLTALLAVLTACDNQVPAHVDKVVDSATFVMRVDNRQETVVLIGLDSPPLDEPPWGEDAAKLAYSLIKDNDGRVYLEFDRQKYDDKGRLLAYVWTSHGMLNETLLRRGLAQAHTTPPNTYWATRLRLAQARGMKNRAGFWKIGGPNSPSADIRLLNDRIKAQQTIP